MTAPKPEKNPYELQGRTDGPFAPVAGRAWTEAEQAERLGGYLEVTADLWALVRPGTHVRYFTKKDGFRPGGFVQQNPFDCKPKGAAAEKRYLRLQNGFNSKAPGYASWLVDYEALDRLYMKPDAGALVVLHALEEAVKGLNANVQKVFAHSKQLEARLAALEARR